MMSRLRVYFFLLPALIFWTQIGLPQSDDAEQRLRAMAQELRCLVCQNQNLADSNAPLAEDLRKEIRQLIKQGQSDQQIRDFMVSRYGDFVLYQPPLKTSTSLLWFGPFVLFALGLLIVGVVVRRRSRQLPELSPDEEKRLRRILGEEKN